MGMACNSQKIYGGNYYAHSFIRNIKRRLGQLYYSRLIRRQNGTRILVVLHLFYMDAWKEICEYLKNLSPYNYTLIVTFMDGCYDEETLEAVKAFKPETHFIKHDNIGWDVLPFITALHTVDLSDYDIVFKLQSKGTKRREIFLYGQYFRYRSWFLNLFEGCIGSFTVHAAIRNLLDEKQNIGLIAAKNLIVEDPIHKQHMVEETVKELNLPYPENYKFVAGTCFAIRANLLNYIKKMDFDEDKFRDNGFSFAHRLERIICFPPLWEGMKISGPNVLLLRRSLWVFYPFAWWWRKYNGVRILKDSQVHVDDEYAFNCIEPILIKNWKFLEIKVGDIKRELHPQDKNLIYLSETLPYKYLVTRDPVFYDAYTKYNSEVWKTDIMSKERFDKLISSMDKMGDTQDNNIVVKENNIICDGQHRCCWLLFNKGPEHIVNALCIQRYYPSLPFLIRVFNFLQYRFSLMINHIALYFNLK